MNFHVKFFKTGFVANNIDKCLVFDLLNHIFGIFICKLYDMNCTQGHPSTRVNTIILQF